MLRRTLSSIRHVFLILLNGPLNTFCDLRLFVWRLCARKMFLSSVHSGPPKNYSQIPSRFVSWCIRRQKLTNWYAQKVHGYIINSNPRKWGARRSRIWLTILFGQRFSSYMISITSWLKCKQLSGQVCKITNILLGRNCCASSIGQCLLDNLRCQWELTVAHSEKKNYQTPYVYDTGTCGSAVPLEGTGCYYC